MTLRQQIIQDRIEDIAQQLGIQHDEAFLRFVHSIVTGQSTHAFDQSDLVDGGQDKQIDTISIEQDDDEATVYIIQAKNTGSFSSNQLIQMSNGLDWIFSKPKDDISSLSNIKFKDKLFAYRAVQREFGFANMHIIVAFVTNGRTSELSDEYKQEMKAIRDRYDNNTFAEFKLLTWGSDELVEQINILEKNVRKINADVQIKYDVNNPSLIKYYVEGLKGLVCTVSAREVARLVNGDAAGSVFDSNIRRFLGTRGAVNADILKTCVDAETSHQFWFLNNGITIVCDSFDAVTVPDDAHIKIKNMQIVNGCQTATTLALAERRGELAPDVRVLLRICEATDSELVGKIVLTTNNQNKISSRDLRANDPIQADMERGFAKYNYFYERKLRQHDNQKGVAAKRIIANDTVAQSYLAVVLKTPSDAYGRKYKVWGELFNKIFGGGIIEPYVIAVQIYRHCLLWIGLSGYTKDADDVRRKLANSAAFHISRITSFYWRGGDDYKVKDTILQAQIETLEHNPQILDPHIENAFDLLENIIRTQPAYQADLDRTLKSSQLDADIDRALHSRQSRNQKPKTKHRHSPEQPQFEL